MDRKYRANLYFGRMQNSNSKICGVFELKLTCKIVYILFFWVRGNLREKSVKMLGIIVQHWRIGVTNRPKNELARYATITTTDWGTNSQLTADEKLFAGFWFM